MENVTLEEGKNGLLNCAVTGFPGPSVTWLEDKTSTRFFENPLPLINVRRNQAGDYICEAYNTCGNDSKSGILTVNCKYIYAHWWLNWLSIRLLGGVLQVQLWPNHPSAS